MTDTQSLLRQYVEQGSESAFRDLVTRYIDLVYSVAFRRVGGDTHFARDVAQTVFIDLARKARSLPADVTLGGWLHRHTCFVSSTAIRSERRRHIRERTAVEMNVLYDSSDANWKQAAPILDEVIDQLGADDRQAIILRFFERRDLRAVGAALGANEDAAQKRVSRALDKLRDLLVQRGVTLTLTALVASLASRAVFSAPVGLATSITSAALVAGASGAGWAAGILKLLASLPVKLALGAVAVAILATSLVLHYRNAGDVQKQHTGASLPDSVRVVPATTSDSASKASANANLTAADASVAESNVLHLTILDADSGQPVPNVPIDYWCWEGPNPGRGRRRLSGSRTGNCDVSFPRATTTRLELTTRIDGFADTRLHWQVDRGESIPTNYTLRLVRPVPIGGRVVDADGRPVAGAKVGFNAQSEPAPATTQPEDHEFGWIEVSTDADGRWSINRIAPEMIRRLYGSARHPEHVDTALLYPDRDPEAEQQLRGGTYVFQLGRALSLRGIVVDPDGRPVPEARILVGQPSNSDRREATSLIDGTFTVTGCKPGENLLTAEVKGFAPATIDADLQADSQPFRLTLQRGQMLILRVVDNNGSPVPKARVWLDTIFSRAIGATRPSSPPVQADFNRSTDAEGLLVWTNAPDAELQFTLRAPGYMALLDTVKIRPDGQEHVVTLPPAGCGRHGARCCKRRAYPAFRNPLRLAGTELQRRFHQRTVEYD